MARKILGWAMMAAPFLILFVASVSQLGIVTALITWAAIVLLIAWVGAAVTLLME